MSIIQLCNVENYVAFMIWNQQVCNGRMCIVLHKNIMIFICNVLPADFPHDFFVWAVSPLTYKQQETHDCVLNTVSTDTLVLKHEAINIHSADNYPFYWTGYWQKMSSSWTLFCN